jgi:hypothetical protein
MQARALTRFCTYLLLSGLSLSTMTGQTTDKQQPTAACPARPSTLRAMRDCYRPLLVFASTMDDAKMISQLDQLKAHPADVKSRDLLFVPIVPEGHNQPIPGSKIHTASLSEDELAAVRHRFQVEPPDFLVILLGKDGGEKLHSQAPVSFEKLKELIDSMPMRRGIKQPGDQ